MKIKIKEDYLQIMARKHPAQAGYSGHERSYRDSVRDIVGKWVEVDTQFLFVDQFNVIHPKGYLIHMSHEGVEDIDFGDMTFEGFQYLVKKRYFKNWSGVFKESPSAKEKVLEFYHIKRILKKQGKFPYDPAIELQKFRKYSLAGKTEQTI
jgi:hypothetical protein